MCVWGTSQVVDAKAWSDIRRERLVKNELAFRDYNNRRVTLEQQAAAVLDEDDRSPFVCECGDADCIGALMVTVAQYMEAHSAPNRFIVKPGHVYPDVERVASEHDSHWVVEKFPGEMP